MHITFLRFLICKKKKKKNHKQYIISFNLVVTDNFVVCILKFKRFKYLQGTVYYAH